MHGNNGDSQSGIIVTDRDVAITRSLADRLSGKTFAPSVSVEIKALLDAATPDNSWQMVYAIKKLIGGAE